MFKTILLLMFTVTICFCISCTTNPITGEDEFMLFGEDSDVEIGKKYAPEIEKEMGGRIENEDLQNYVNNIGNKVARVSHWAALDYHYVALNDESLNALALPGGYIFITRGMLEKLTSEAQLAAILGHETVHVVTRDVSNMMSNQIGISILLSAALSQQSSRGLQTAASLTRQIIGLTFSREDERTADRGGLDYMVRAGYNPYGMVETMRILQSEEKDRMVEFFSTHPSPENRIDYITEVIQSRYFNLTGLRTGADTYKKAVLDNLPELKDEDKKP